MNWISVKDELPPLMTEVLVLLTEPRVSHLPYTSSMTVAFMYQHEPEPEKYWNVFGNPTHWMTLPEKPNG